MPRKGPDLTFKDSKRGENNIVIRRSESISSYASNLNFDIKRVQRNAAVLWESKTVRSTVFVGHLHLVIRPCFDFEIASNQA